MYHKRVRIKMINNDGPVIVRAFKTTRDEDIVNVEFVQSVLRPTIDSGAVLNVLMAGHSSFGSPYQTRVAYQNMSRQQFEKFGLDVGKSFPATWNARLVVHEFCEGDEIPESIKSSFPTIYKTSTYVPRTWDGANGPVIEKPKMTVKVEGKEQQVLTRDGQAIYRSVFFTLEGQDQTDHLVKHTQSVIGTTNSIKQEEVPFEQPQMP